MASEYCTVCGKECTVKVMRGFFSSSTGIESSHLACSTGICYHDGVWHDYERMKKAWWLYFGGNYKKCTKCGDVIQTESSY